MAYAVQQDITDRYGEAFLTTLADRNGDGIVDAAAVSKALADASTEIDSYLAARYPLPLAVVPEVLTRLAVDIAVYRLGYAPGAGADESKRERYEDAVALLRDLSKGTASLGIESPAPSVGGVVTVAGSERLFTRDTMKGLA